MFAKGLNLLTQPPRTIASDDAAFKAIQPMILQVAPSSIKSDLEQIFTFRQRALHRPVEGWLDGLEATAVGAEDARHDWSEAEAGVRQGGRLPRLDLRARAADALASLPPAVVGLGHTVLT